MLSPTTQLVTHPLLITLHLLVLLSFSISQLFSLTRPQPSHLPHPSPIPHNPSCTNAHPHRRHLPTPTTIIGTTNLHHISSLHKLIFPSLLHHPLGSIDERLQSWVFGGYPDLTSAGLLYFEIRFFVCGVFFFWVFQSGFGRFFFGSLIWIFGCWWFFFWVVWWLVAILVAVFEWLVLFWWLCFLLMWSFGLWWFV